MDTQQVGLLAIPLAGALAMHAPLPVPVFVPVALAAEFVGLGKRYRRSTREVEHITVFGIVAVQTPPVFIIVMKIRLDIVVELEFPARRVDFPIHFCVMALATGKDPFGERRRFGLHQLFLFWGFHSLGWRGDNP